MESSTWRRAGIWDTVYKNKTKARVATHAHDSKTCKAKRVSGQPGYSKILLLREGRKGKKRRKKKKEKGRRKKKEELPGKTLERRLGRWFVW